MKDANILARANSLSFYEDLLRDVLVDLTGAGITAGVVYILFKRQQAAAEKRLQQYLLRGLSQRLESIGIAATELVGKTIVLDLLNKKVDFTSLQDVLRLSREEHIPSSEIWRIMMSHEMDELMGKYFNRIDQTEWDTIGHLVKTIRDDLEPYSKYLHVYMPKGLALSILKLHDQATVTARWADMGEKYSEVLWLSYKRLLTQLYDTLRALAESSTDRSEYFQSILAVDCTDALGTDNRE